MFPGTPGVPGRDIRESAGARLLSGISGGTAQLLLLAEVSLSSRGPSATLSGSRPIPKA